jgi:hypothetical protein
MVSNDCARRHFADDPGAAMVARLSGSDRQTDRRYDANLPHGLPSSFLSPAIVPADISGGNRSSAKPGKNSSRDPVKR